MQTVVTAPSRTVTAGAYDRAFYSGMAIVMALTVLVGFARSYYLRPLFDPGPTVTGLVTLSPLTHLHGIVFSAWVVLFVLQTQLVARRRIALHRQMGTAGVGLAIVMIVVGIATAIAAGRRGSAPAGMEPLVFLVVPVFDILFFAGFVAAAVYARRNREAHKRLMLLAYVSVIVAAVARIPGVVTLGPPGLMGLTLLFVVAGIVYDRWSRGRVHPVYWWGGALLAASFPGRLALAQTPAWRAFAQWMIS